MKNNKTVQMLADRITETGSMLCVGLDMGPQTADLYTDAHPNPLSFNRHLIDLTHEVAACYKPQLAGYLALGEAGIGYLKETVAYIKKTHPTIPVLLDAKFSDISVSLENYAIFTFDVLGVDAVTANPLLGKDAAAPLLARKDKLIYFLCSTSNPGSAEFQGYGEPKPLYLEVAAKVSEWNESGNCGLVVGATHPDRVRAIRSVAPELPFLVPGLGAQGGDPDSFLPFALSGHPSGVICNASRGIMLSDDPAKAAQSFANQISDAAMAHAASPTIPRETVLLLEEAGCVQYGIFTLASGEASSIYIDLRLLLSHPSIMAKIAKLLNERIQALDYEKMITIPTAGLPLGTAMVIESGKPLLYVRKNAKDYGRQKQVEGGVLEPGDKVLIFDDVISSGGSKVDAIEVLREAGADIIGMLVVVDRRTNPGEPFMDVPVYSLATLIHLAP